MFTVSRQQFETMVNAAVQSLPGRYVEHLQNVAIIVETEPSDQQRQNLKLRGDQTLFGLYEGVPLSARQGALKILPDKITLFQKPLEQASNDLAELQSRVRHTMWHEVAHYYGLDHQRISELE